MTNPLVATPRPLAGALVAWLRAWRRGLVPVDDALAAIAHHASAQLGAEYEHVVRPVVAARTAGPGVLASSGAERADHAQGRLYDGVQPLSALDESELRLVLPAAGDPVGLPGATPFS